jgi:hypothetical protein
LLYVIKLTWCDLESRRVKKEALLEPNLEIIPDAMLEIEEEVDRERMRRERYSCAN